MFIDFAGMMTNINYIINIYKIEDNSMRRQKYCIIIKYNNIQNYQNIKEIYDNEEERDKRFSELYNLVDAK